MAYELIGLYDVVKTMELIVKTSMTTALTAGF